MNEIYGPVILIYFVDIVRACLCSGPLMFHFGLQVQIEGEEAQRLSKRRLERERARRDATADMSEDLSEGEKGEAIGDLSVHGDSTRGRMPRISSVDAIEALTSQFKDKKLYIVLIRYG